LKALLGSHNPICDSAEEGIHQAEVAFIEYINADSHSAWASAFHDDPSVGRYRWDQGSSQPYSSSRSPKGQRGGNYPTCTQHQQRDTTCAGRS
jgi:hypothetical protein